MSVVLRCVGRGNLLQQCLLLLTVAAIAMIAHTMSIPCYHARQMSSIMQYLLLKGGPWFDDEYIPFMLSLVKVTIWYTCTHIHTHTQTHTHTSGKAAQYSPKLQSELNNSIVVHIQLWENYMLIKNLFY